MWLWVGVQTWLYKFSCLLSFILIEVDVCIWQAALWWAGCHLLQPQFNLCNSISATIFTSLHSSKSSLIKSWNFALGTIATTSKNYVCRIFLGEPQNTVHLLEPLDPRIVISKAWPFLIKFLIQAVLKRFTNSCRQRLLCPRWSWSLLVSYCCFWIFSGIQSHPIC